jgi:hypothetical protein
MSSQTKKQPIHVWFSIVITILFTANACEQIVPANLPTSTQTVSKKISTPFSTSIPTSSSQIISKRPEGKFLFIEIWLSINGLGKVPSALIDRPSYSFNNQSKELIYRHNSIEELLDLSTLGFIGQGRSLHGTAGTGSASGLTIIQSFPMALDITIATGEISNRDTPEYILTPVLFSSVLSDGTILIEIQENLLALKPNESWSLAKEIIFSSEKYNGRLNITSSMTNYGWLATELINP